LKNINLVISMVANNQLNCGMSSLFEFEKI